jgi:hypothetical protein
MRSRVWSCSSCIVLLVSALLGREATASHVGRQKKDLIHRVAKAQVTPHVARRDDSTCQADYSLCPASLSGGCCPNAYECETDSCYATTAGTTSACGKAGWFWCPASDSGEFVGLLVPTPPSANTRLQEGAVRMDMSVDDLTVPLQRVSLIPTPLVRPTTTSVRLRTTLGAA